MTRALITDFRANGGRVTSGPFAGRPVLLLTTTGARSGEPRLAPLVYSRDGDAYVIVASKGGSPTQVVLSPGLLGQSYGSLTGPDAEGHNGRARSLTWRGEVRPEQSS